MATVAFLATRFLTGYLLAAAAVQAASGESDISCKYLLGAMATALVGTNSFWAIWTRTILKDKDAVTDARIADLRQAALKIKSD